MDGRNLTSQMVHYPTIKMTNQIVQYSINKKDHPFILDESKSTSWYFLRLSKWGLLLLDSLVQKTMNCSSVPKEKRNWGHIFLKDLNTLLWGKQPRKLQGFNVFLIYTMDEYVISFFIFKPFNPREKHAFLQETHLWRTQPSS